MRVCILIISIVSLKSIQVEKGTYIMATNNKTMIVKYNYIQPF